MANQQSKNMKGGPASRQRAEIIHQWWSVALQAKEPEAPLLFNCQKMSVNEEKNVWGGGLRIQISDALRDASSQHSSLPRKKEGSDR